MNQEKNRQKENALDLAYIFRCLWKNAWVILMSACIAGMLSYMFLDTFQNDTTYTIGVRLSVVSRENTGSQLSEGSINNAVSKCVNILNSNILKEQIQKKNTENKLAGDYLAVSIPNTNLITLRATADSAEGAFCLLNAALDEFPTLTSYFNFGYGIKILEPVDAGAIVVNDAGTAKQALKIAFFVVAAAVGLVVLFCYMTDILHSKEQAESILAVEVLGVQHYVKKGKKQKAILISDESVDVSYMEEIEKLVTRIQEKMSAKNEKTIMVSSIKENEGKSTIAANIALCLAKRGKRVLLMDADLRRPAVYKIFEKKVNPKKQISQCLEGKVLLDQCICAEKEQEGLFYLFQEKAVAQPDILLETEGFQDMLEQLKLQMDYVILDTPPIGIIRDAELVAARADAALLVIRQDYVRGEVVNDVVDVLDETGTDVLGTVMTMAKGRELSASGRGKYGNYYYGYGQKREKRR